MGIKGLWTDALGLFNASQYETIAVIAQKQAEGKRLTLAVDISIWLNKYCMSETDKIATTCNPPYPAPDLLHKIQEIHREITKYINLIYVFDGRPNELKDATRAGRSGDRERDGAAWIELRRRALEDGVTTFTQKEIDEATTSRMKMKKPTAADHANVLNWMKEDGIQCIGSLEEADLQLIKLEKDGVVDGIISEDGDEFALGAKMLYCKMNRKKNGEYQFKVLDRDKFFHQSNPYKSKLNKYPQHVIDAALLLGNDYVPRIHNNGAATVLLGSLVPIDKLPANATEFQKKEHKQKKKNRKRLDDSMIDNLAAATCQKEWLLQHQSPNSQ